METYAIITLMITSNIVHRVFRIRYGGSEATAFTIDVDQRQYIVTAKHAVTGLTDGNDVDFFAHGAWKSEQVRLVGHALEDRDVSVFAVNRILTPDSLPMPATSVGVIYGQDVFFLGFPYGYTGKYTLTEDGYPLPFVKKATVSLLDEGTFLLDGHNNPGFSGGPVVFTQPGKNDYSVFAVISAYKIVDEPVYVGNVPAYAGPNKPLVFRYNTGIIVTWAVDYAVELARANPVGMSLEGSG